MSVLFPHAFWLVQAANPLRKIDNLNRRLLKMEDESGEFVQAFLNVTSKANPKRLTWADVREEGIDTLVPIIDTLLTALPLDDATMTTEHRIAVLVMGLKPDKMPKPAIDDDRILAFRRGCGKYISFYLEAKRLSLKVPAGAPLPYHAKGYWRKFRDEGVRCIRRLMPLLVAEMPDQIGSDHFDREQQLHGLLMHKLKKWEENRRVRGQTTEDDV